LTSPSRRPLDGRWEVVAVLEQLTWFKQSSYLWKGHKVVYIDPWDVRETDPKADLVFITHAHFDHYSEPDLSKVVTEKTVLVAPHDVADQCLKRGDVRGVKPGETLEAGGFQVEAVAAYNQRSDRKDFHPRDNNWVGYVISIDGERVYFAGDTDHTEEVGAVRTDIAFLPIGGTYTMDIEEAIGASKAIGPRIAVPCHYGFVVGSQKLGDQFVKAIAPIEGKTLKPVHGFEQP
jgi:L-ascorbate metabolism protein UlaG (beta-lactamase superfamily)